MPKVKLDEPVLYGGVTYGPGENVDLPEEAHEDLKSRNLLPEQEPQEPGTPVRELDSVGPGLAAEMEAAGYSTVEKLKDAKDDEVVAAVGSLGKDRLKDIRKEAKGS